MNWNYKRSFGRKKTTTPATPGCQHCGEHTVCAVPVFIRATPESEARVVCYKNYCIACGKIQAFTDFDKEGNPRRTYAFFMGAARKCRDFFLPPEMYESGGKADVGLKVRLVRALMRLQVKRPTEKMFLAREVYEELANDPQKQ